MKLAELIVVSAKTVTLEVEEQQTTEKEQRKKKDKSIEREERRELNWVTYLLYGSLLDELLHEHF